MKLGLAVTTLAAAAIFLGAAPVHLTLIDSNPKEDALLAESPDQIWLRFNESLDVAKCGIGVRGPEGAVELAKVELVDSVSISAKVLSPLSPGQYTVSWLGTPVNDHAVRGRYKFSVEGER
jgi:methionine-rich copper-binding protein CopC